MPDSYAEEQKDSRLDFVDGGREEETGVVNVDDPSFVLQKAKEKMDDQ